MVKWLVLVFIVFDVFPGLVLQAAGEFEEDYVDMVLWMDAQCEELQL